MSITYAPTPGPDAPFRRAVTEVLGEGNLDASLLGRLAAASDASHYRLDPLAVARPTDTDQIVSLFRLCQEFGLPLTFRSGGTSLSGQAGTSGLLVDVRRSFKKLAVLDGGLRIRLEPGVTLRAANAALAPYGRKLGPDPASEVACTIGGIVANNSSGMECGTSSNSYRTIESATLVLPSGTIIDTARHDAEAYLRRLEPELVAGLLRLRDRVRSNPESMRIVKQQYSIKNTMGYGLNSFVDFDDPVSILTHLVVGSEGTLAYIADVTLSTVPALSLASSTLLVFPSILDATAALPELTARGARAIELLDSASLTVAQGLSRVDPSIQGLRIEDHAALLVDLASDTALDLQQQVLDTESFIAELPLSRSARFVDGAARSRMWQMRKGLYPAVAGARPAGSSSLLEDFAVPPERLSRTVSDLQALLTDFDYTEAVIFGHAKDGNLHFMINPSLAHPAGVRRYEAFTEGLVQLVLGNGGTLKAEHGTGRAMASFVERQFGSELFSVMVALKELFDPTMTLNPEVLITHDRQLHLKSLKTIPVVDAEIDKCVECGYCETVCPSRDLTTTPRQRIALMRAAPRLTQAERSALAESFEYAAVQTCAADSLCVTVCPVEIDTGGVMKRLRADRLGATAQAIGASAARHYAGVTTGLRAGLGAAKRMPEGMLSGGSRLARRAATPEWIPLLEGDLPGPGSRRDGSGGAYVPGVAAVHFNACVDSLFGPSDPSVQSVHASLAHICAVAGIDLRTPHEMGRLCCGTPWASKGLVKGDQLIRSRTAKALHRASEGGRLPVVVDASSCTHGLAYLRDTGLDVVDVVTFVVGDVLPRLQPAPRLGRIALHPTCATTHLGDLDDLMSLARFCADEIYVPPSWGCCGFAGDRGLLHPELTESATRHQTAELIASGPFDAYVSHNRTCEIAMTRATKQTYTHIIQLMAALPLRRL